MTDLNLLDDIGVIKSLQCLDLSHDLLPFVFVHILIHDLNGNLFSCRCVKTELYFARCSWSECPIDLELTDSPFQLLNLWLLLVLLVLLVLRLDQKAGKEFIELFEFNILFGI